MKITVSFKWSTELKRLGWKNNYAHFWYEDYNGDIVLCDGHDTAKGKYDNVYPAPTAEEILSKLPADKVPDIHILRFPSGGVWYQFVGFTPYFSLADASAAFYCFLKNNDYIGNEDDLEASIKMVSEKGIWKDVPNAAEYIRKKRDKDTEKEECFFEKENRRLWSALHHIATWNIPPLNKVAIDLQNEAREAITPSGFPSST